jgi:hypothetical protein
MFPLGQIALVIGRLLLMTGAQKFGERIAGDATSGRGREITPRPDYDYYGKRDY